ncbi:DUF6164 family protein [Methylomonas sp. SURF-2]|uniref:DUF6164 family protein n=1 Tax=Methylomonas subterranea TaxID=2952225 RepID=A0ABT1TJT0_9GAMM|nr:DUF6164 family protein [Methylomonas sp. SURF-2]MCQ8105732.1 DUF6164 family protein [Methylomonas sp. SURF-2]
MGEPVNFLLMLSMSILFFNLRGVPADEADEVRELLSANDIAFYETSAGLLGISLAAIWLQRPDDLAFARQLFDAYQQQRAEQQRALYRERLRQGRQAGFFRHNLQHPLRFIALCVASLLVIYLSSQWVIGLSP